MIGTPRYAGLLGRLTAQSMIATDDSAPPLAHYFFGTTPVPVRKASWKVVQVLAQIAPTQTIVVAGPSIGKPKAALVMVSSATSIGTLQDGMRIGMGFTDGTTQRATSSFATDNDTTPNAGTRDDTETIIQLCNAGATSINGEARWTGWIENGMTMAWDDQVDATYVLTVVFFYGDDFQAFITDVVGANSVGGEVDINTVPFTPVTILGIFQNLSAFGADNTLTHARLGLGVAVLDQGNTQYASLNFYEFNNPGITTKGGQSIRDDGLFRSLTANDINITDGARLSVSQWFSDGARFLTSFVAESVRGALMFMRWGSGVRQYAGDTGMDVQVGTNQTLTNPGFRGRAGMMLGGSLNVFNTSGALRRGSYGFFTATEQAQTGHGQQNNVDPSNTRGVALAKAAGVMDDSGTYDWAATFVSWDMLGPVFLVDDLSGAARKSVMWILGDAFISASPTVQADTATTAIAAQKRMNTSLAVSAGAATTTFDMDVIRQTSVAVTAATATAVASGDVIEAAIETTVTVTAETATAAIAAQLVRQASVTVQAGAATTTFDMDVIRQASVAVTAPTATTAIAGQLVHQATAAANANTATASIAAQLVHHAAVTVTAGAATVLFDMDVVRQTSVSVTAGAATAAASGQHVSQTTLILSAGAATTTFDMDVVRQTSVAVTAATATASIAGQLVHQTTVTAQCATATTNISAEIAGTISTDVTVTAETATASIAAQKRMNTSLAVSAGAASAVFDADVIRQTSVAVSQNATSVAIDADVVRQATAAVSQGAASAIISGQLVRHTTLVLQAGAAVTVFDADKISQSSVAASASTATTNAPSQVVHQTTTAVQANTATASISGSVIRVNGSVTAQADTATVAISASVIRQANVALQAPATAAAVGQHVSQTSLVLQANTATVLISTVFGAGTREGDVVAQCSTAITGIVGQRVIQTVVAVQAQRAIARAFETVVPVRLAPPGVVFVHEPAVLFFDTWPVKLIATAVAVRAGAATTNISGDVL